MILRRLTVGRYATNCYLVGDEVTGEGLVIDPGDNGADIIAAARQAGLNVRTIALTHGHFDHVGAVREVAEMLLRAQGRWDEILSRYLD